MEIPRVAIKHQESLCVAILSKQKCHFSIFF
jgi:hypothetical protein